MYCPVLPWTQANVESEASDGGIENVQIFQSPVDVQAFQFSSKPWDQSRRNKAHCWRTMEGSFGIGGYCPPCSIIVRNRLALCRRPSFPVIERNIKGVKNRWGRSVVSDSQLHFIVHERVTPTHVELKHSQSRYSCAPADICGLFQNAGLDSRFRFLLFDGLPRDPQQLQLQTASYRQKQAEKPRPPLINVVQNRLLFVVYRDGRDACEGYAVLGLLGAYFGCLLGIYWGLCRIDDGHRRTGHMILALAIA